MLKKKGPEPNPQKYTWKTHSQYPDFDTADQKRNSLKEEGVTVKVSRRKKGFFVRTGTQVKETPKNEAPQCNRPTSQAFNLQNRDHNPKGSLIMLAGGSAALKKEPSK